MAASIVCLFHQTFKCDALLLEVQARAGQGSRTTYLAACVLGLALPFLFIVGLQHLPQPTPLDLEHSLDDGAVVRTGQHPLIKMIPIPERKPLQLQVPDLDHIAVPETSHTELVAHFLSLPVDLMEDAMLLDGHGAGKRR